MTDIQQWRKKIQPSKARTPLDPEDVVDAQPQQTTTPKRCLKKKVSSYFDLGQNSKTAPFHEEAPTTHMPAWPLDELYPDSNAEDEMDSVMCVLMTEPYSRLDVRYNSALMRIFESYLQLKRDKEDLEQKVQEASNTTQSVISQFNMAHKDWSDKERDYKDEIKRLEVLLAKSSRRGLAEVTLARQDSKLRRYRYNEDDQKETIFEFLERSNRNSGRFYDNQRATMKPAPLSPSHKEKTWSQKLTQKKSMTNIHADLPFGTPPDGDMRFSLTQASFLEQQTERRSRQRAVTNSTIESDDTFSSFACEGEALPQVTVTGNGEQPPETTEDHADIGRLAQALAQRRNIDPSQVMPQLLELFDPQRTPTAPTMSNNPGALGITAPQPQRNPSSTRVFSADHAVVKRKTVVAKASDLFHKLKPQLGVDSPTGVRGLHRRFSFEPGDDAAAQRISPENDASASGENRILRKSVSVDVLRNNPPTTTAVDRSLSPVPSSPTVSVTPIDGRPPSRIPTPVMSRSSLAKPRAEREDSASSLLTAIRQADDASKRSNSLTSSAYSSPSPKTEDPSLNRISHYNDYGLAVGSRTCSSNRLLDHTASLRNQAASAAPRNASSSGDVGVDSRGTPKQPGGRSNHSHSGYSDNGNENLQPMASRTKPNDQTH